MRKILFEPQTWNTGLIAFNSIIYNQALLRDNLCLVGKLFSFIIHHDYLIFLQQNSFRKLFCNEDMILISKHSKPCEKNFKYDTERKIVAEYLAPLLERLYTGKISFETFVSIMVFWSIIFVHAWDIFYHFYMFPKLRMLLRESRK